MIRLILLCFGTSCFGTLAAAGVFTVLAMVGLVPRLVGKTHTANHILAYENMVILGTIVGAVVSLFTEYCTIGNYLADWAKLLILVSFGLFSGIFIGCLALAIAEMLDSIPIFARRLSFRHGLGIAVLCMALGKIAGSLFYFMNAMGQE